MNYSKDFFKLDTTGITAGIIGSEALPADVKPEDFIKLTANTTDAAQEKHVPFPTYKDGILDVKVGSVLHPMTEEHHIVWIAVVQDNRTQIVNLEHTASPESEFSVFEADLTVYAYCNLHGLWATDVSFDTDNGDELVCSPEFPDGCM
ncbi:MAG: desulfoferrodoxin family protein [Lachnospiraceae bacterium]